MSVEFYVEDVHATRRYVVKLKPEDIERVRCRTIRRHLVQSPGFPYLAHEFDLYGGHPNSFQLHDDDVGPSFQLKSGSVIKLFPRRSNSSISPPQRNSHARADDQQSKPTATASSVRLVSSAVVKDDDSPITHSIATEALDDDKELLEGLSDRQRALQARLIQEYRSSASRQRDDSQSPTPHRANAVQTGGSMQTTDFATVADTQKLRRSLSLYDESPVRLHHPPSYDASTPGSESCDNTYTVGVTAAAQPSRFLNGVPVSSVTLKLTPSQTPSTAAESKLSNKSVKPLEPQTCSQCEIGTLLQEDLLQLISLVETLRSSNSSAQLTVTSLREALQSSEEQLRSANTTIEALRKDCIRELRVILAEHHRVIVADKDIAKLINVYLQRKEEAAALSRCREELASSQRLLSIEQSRRRQAQLELDDMKGNIRVVIRVRPANVNRRDTYHQDSVLGDTKVILDAQRGTIGTSSPTSGTRLFEFYRVMDDTSTQLDVFSEVAPLVQCCVDGVNVSIIAYGQTGSGKTHTILGDANTDLHHTAKQRGGDGAEEARQGLVIRALRELFLLLDHSEKVNTCVMCSLVELYNEQVFDLLSTNGNDGDRCGKLDVKSAAVASMLISKHQVRSADDAIALLLNGSRSRQVHATKLNSQSSRSHLLFTVHVSTQKFGSANAEAIESKMVFADLAGSERVAASQSTGDRLKEAQFINKSLSSLGDVVSALSSLPRQQQAAKVDAAVHIPYRNSKLTMLLQDSIGGMSKTVLIACVAPFDGDNGAVTNLHETTSTLQFASRVRLVRNNITPHSKAPPASSSAKHQPALSQCAAKHIVTEEGSDDSVPVRNQTQMLRSIPLNQPQRSSSAKTPVRKPPPLRF